MAWRGEATLDRLTVLTTCAALVGLSFVVDVWHAPARGHLIGVGLAFLGAVTTVGRVYIWGRQTRERDPALVGAECFVVAAFLSLFLLFWKSPQLPVTWQGDGYALLGCGVSALGTFGMFYGISVLGSFRWSLLMKLEPVFTSLFSVWLLGEILKPLQYMGIAAVLVSLASYQLWGAKKAL